MTFDICMKFLSQYAIYTLFLCNTFVRCHSCEDVLSIRDCVRKCLETFSSRSTILALYYKSTSMEKSFPQHQLRNVGLCVCACVYLRENSISNAGERKRKKKKETFFTARRLNFKEF